MRHIIWKIALFASLALLSVVIVAQANDCPMIVETALNSLDTLCTDTGRNQACYGNVSIETQFQTDMTDIQFTDVGDIIDVSTIQSMQLSPMDDTKWGLALLRLQANIPDTLPGQNVTFLLFGDVEITNASDDFADTDLAPMQAFYLKTGIGDAGCEEAPESGMLVQTPDGISEVAFNINGVDVAMGSTILFQAEANQDMTVSAVEGSAMMELDGNIHTAIAGMELRIPIDEHFRPTGPPPPPEAYREDTMRRVPSERLDRPIPPPPPMPNDQVLEAQEMIRNGQPPCDRDGFPACEKLPTGGLREGPGCRQEQGNCYDRLAPHESKGIKPPEDNRTCVYQPRDDQPPLPADETRPFCEDAEPQQQMPEDNRDCVYQPREGDPPLPTDETRPFCEDAEPQQQMPEDNRDCVYQPREGDPPLPADETRPFCEDSEPQQQPPKNNGEGESSPKK
jgi:hypothetical protein